MRFVPALRTDRLYVTCSAEMRMMMKKMKKTMVLLMALMMCFIMAGCKKETGEEVPTGNVYVPTFSEIQGDIDWINNIMSSGNKISLLGEVYDRETYEYSEKLITLDVVTGEQSSRDLSFGGDDDKVSTSLQTIVRYKDGYMAVLYHYTMPTQEEMDSGYYEEQTSYDIVILDADFNELSTVSLDELSKKVEEETGWFYAQYIAGDQDGNIYIGGDNAVYVLNSEGKQLYEIKFTNWINGMVATDDGQILVMYYDDQQEMALAPIDKNARAMGEALENVPVGNGNTGFFPAGNGKIYMNSSTKLYLYDLNTQTSEVILDWVNCDINTYNLSGFATLEDGSFVAVSVNYDHSGDDTKTTIELANIKEVPASSVKQKKIVTLAMMYLNYDMQEQVIKFNRTNEDYRIQVKTYVNDDYSNYEDAYTLFQSDIASGNAGDFFLAGNGDINVDNLIAKGALADLTKLIETDEQIKMDDFIPNIIDVLSVDGKLYSISDSFNVQTLVGKVADVGEGRTWTFKDVMELVKARPDSQLLSYSTKDSVLSTMLVYSMDCFYNSETGECSFDSEDFVQLLEICNTFPTEYNYDDEEYVSLPTQLRSGKVLLTQLYLSDFDEVQLYSKLYGEPVNFIGYPTNGTSGSVAGFDNRFCINAKSKNKEGAWAFIRQFLLPDYQNNLEWRMPINKAAFEQRLADAMKVDEDNVGSSWMYDDVEIEMGPLDEAMVQTIRDIVYGINTESVYDESLYNIISEEAAYYFGGEKSASEIAGIIQSRVQIYIDENR